MANKTVENRLFVNGEDTTLMGEGQIMSAIKANNEQINQLNNTGVESARVLQRIGKLKEANQGLVKALDRFVEEVPATPEA